MHGIHGVVDVSTKGCPAVRYRIGASECVYEWRGLIPYGLRSELGRRPEDDEDDKEDDRDGR